MRFNASSESHAKATSCTLFALTKQKIYLLAHVLRRKSMLVYPWEAVNNYWTELLDWTTGLDHWTGLLDWTSGLDYWTGLLDRTTVLLEWTTWLDYLTGLLDWTTWLDYWTGLLHWTTGLDYWTAFLHCVMTRGIALMLLWCADNFLTKFKYL